MWQIIVLILGCIGLIFAIFHLWGDIQTEKEKKKSFTEHDHAGNKENLFEDPASIYIGTLLEFTNKEQEEKNIVHQLKSIQDFESKSFEEKKILLEYIQQKQSNALRKKDTFHIMSFLVFMLRITTIFTTAFGLFPKQENRISKLH